VLAGSLDRAVSNRCGANWCGTNRCGANADRSARFGQLPLCG
jgi:hypothetical protein